MYLVVMYQICSIQSLQVILYAVAYWKYGFPVIQYLVAYWKSEGRYSWMSLEGRWNLNSSLLSEWRLLNVFVTAYSIFTIIRRVLANCRWRGVFILLYYQKALAKCQWRVSASSFLLLSEVRLLNLIGGASSFFHIFRGTLATCLLLSSIHYSACAKQYCQNISVSFFRTQLY